MSMDELNAVIAGNISSLRLAAGMTQAELAERLNYTDKLVSKWERGDAAPNAYTLKQISEIFGVSVEYLFQQHDPAESVTAQEQPESTVAETAAEEKAHISYRTLTAVSICGVWTLALLIFVVFWIVTDALVFSVFVYAIPVSLITLLVLNSVWNRGKYNYWIIGGLLISIALTVYVALWKYNCWQIFLLLIPTELIVWLCARIMRRPGGKT